MALANHLSGTTQIISLVPDVVIRRLDSENTPINSSDENAGNLVVTDTVQIKVEFYVPILQESGVAANPSNAYSPHGSGSEFSVVKDQMKPLHDPLNPDAVDEEIQSDIDGLARALVSGFIGGRISTISEDVKAKASQEKIVPDLSTMPSGAVHHTFTETIKLPEDSEGVVEYTVVEGSAIYDPDPDSTDGLKIPCPPRDRTIEFAYNTKKPDIALSRVNQGIEGTKTVDVTGTWTFPVSGFDDDDIVVTLIDEFGIEELIDSMSPIRKMAIARVIHSDGNRISRIDVDTPRIPGLEDTRYNGEIHVTVTTDSVELTENSERKGPPRNRTIKIPYSLNAFSDTEIFTTYPIPSLVISNPTIQLHDDQDSPEIYNRIKSYPEGWAVYDASIQLSDEITADSTGFRGISEPQTAVTGDWYYEVGTGFRILDKIQNVTDDKGTADTSDDVTTELYVWRTLDQGEIVGSPPNDAVIPSSIQKFNEVYPPMGEFSNASLIPKNINTLTIEQDILAGTTLGVAYYNEKDQKVYGVTEIKSGKYYRRTDETGDAIYGDNSDSTNILTSNLWEEAGSVYRNKRLLIRFTWRSAVSDFTYDDVKLLRHDDSDDSDMIMHSGIDRLASSPLSGDDNYKGTLTAEPASAVAGDVYFQTPPGTTNYGFRYYDGASWNNVTGTIDGLDIVRLGSTNYYVIFENGDTDDFIWNSDDVLISALDGYSGIIDTTTNIYMYASTTALMMIASYVSNTISLRGEDDEGDVTLTNIYEIVYNLPADTEGKFQIYVLPKSAKDARLGPSDKNDAPKRLATSGPIDFKTTQTIDPDIPSGTEQLLCITRMIDENEALGTGDISGNITNYHSDDPDDQYLMPISVPTFNQDEHAFGGTFLGASDLVKLGDNLYFVVQIQKRRVGSENERSITLQGGAILCHFDLISNELTILKRYILMVNAARSLTVHQNKLYFFEGSHYAYSQSGRTGGTDALDYRGGFLYEIDTENDPKILNRKGGTWRSEIAVTDELFNENIEHLYLYGGMVSPMVSTHPKTLSNVAELNLIAGHGGISDAEENRREIAHTLNDGFLQFLIDYTKRIPSDSMTPFEITLPSNLASDLNNWNWLKYSRVLEQNIPFLATNKQKGYNVIKELSNLTHSIIGYDNENFFMKPRDPYTAQITAELSDEDTPGTIGFINPNRDFSDIIQQDGLILINRELFKYSAPDEEIDIIIESGEFSNIQRGYSSTTIQRHFKENQIIKIDHILDLEQSAYEPPINDLKYRDDSSQLYNQVEIKYGENGDLIHRQEDYDSIQMNGELETSFTVPLDRHQIPWVKYLANQFIHRNKDMKYLITLVLKPTFFLRLGETVLLRQKWRDRDKRDVHNSGWHIFQTTQVYDISHSFKENTTTCVFRTI